MMQLEDFDAVGDRAARQRIAADAGWALALVIGCVIVTWRASQGGAFIGYEMNADTLLAPAWVEDVRAHAYAWTGFQLARIPSFFPDLLLQWLARAVSPDARWGIFVYCAAQFAGLVFASGWIVRLASGARYLTGVTAAFAVLSAAVMADTLAPAATGIPLMWFQSCAHSGPFILALLAAGVATRLMRRWTLAEGALLFLLVAAAMLSDRLVLMEFVGPVALAALIVSFVSWRAVPGRAWAILGLCAAGVVLAGGLDLSLFREPDVPVSLAGFGGRIALFAHDAPAFLREHLLVMLTVGLPPLAVFTIYPFLAARLQRDEVGEAGDVLAFGRVRLPRDEAFLWLTGAIAFLTVSVCVVLLVCVGPSSWRYWTGVAVWPTIFTAAVLCSLRRAARIVAAAAAAGTAVVLLTASAAPDTRPGPVAWRSPTAACLNAQRDRYGLKAGFGDYWTARPTSFDGGPQMEQMAADGVAFIYGSDVFSLVKQPRGAPGAPSFNFIVTAGLDEAALRDRYGPPTRTFRCDGPAGETVWVYADAVRLTRIVLADFQPPAGSYRSVCTALMVRADLFAECPGPGGAPRYSRLRNANVCFGDIGVNAGKLEGDCARPFRRLRRMLSPPKRRPSPA